MKNLLYKEFRLSMHPICYVFTFVFPLMILIPSYPLGVCLIYICSSYPILFLGANKGQQSNDIFYTALLPVRKCDIVKARMILIFILQTIPLLIMLALLPIASKVRGTLPIEELEDVGLGVEQFALVCASGYLSFSIYDLIFLPMFYKTGRAIVLPTIIGMLVFTILVMVLTIVLPFSGLLGNVIMNMNLLAQLLILLGSLIVYFIIHILIYKMSVKRLEKVDL